MRGFLRCISAVMLIIIMTAFCIWRYEKVDTVMGVTAHLGNAASRLEQLVSLAKNGVEEWVEESGEKPSDLPTNSFDPNSDYSAYDPTTLPNAPLEETIRTGISNLDAKIYLTGFSPAPTKDEVKSMMASIIYSSPEYFYLKPAYKLSVTNVGTVEYIEPTYTVASIGELADMRASYELVLQEIVAGAPQDGTEFDKILYLHDYFVQNYEYDHSLTIRDAYTFFTQKKGVCQAYMLALIAAAERLGMEALPVTSDAMKHAWNLVRIDGEWYHVDLTWDDTRSYETLLSYKYFLQSDAGLIAIDAENAEKDRHRDWVAKTVATNPKYDGAMYRNTNTPIIKHNGVYYCTSKTNTTSSSVRGVILSGTDVTAMTPLRDITGGYWWATSSSFYTDCYAGLVASGNYLYYHSGNSICRLNLNDTNDYRVHLVTDLAPGESIYGFLGVENGTLSYLVASTLVAETYRVGTYTITE